MVVKKFGGSSVADAGKFLQVKNIITAEQDRKAIILSAMKGITNKLISAAKNAAAGQDMYKTEIQIIRDHHLNTINILFTEGMDIIAVKTEVDILLEKLEKVLLGVELVKECSERSMDLVMSYGERLSCLIMSHYLNSTGLITEFIDARQIIRTDNKFGSANVLFEESYTLIQNRIDEKIIPIITGFIASDSENVTTTLGRNGSDFTASIIGAALNADIIEIWTDVDGVLSADPRIVNNAYVIDELSIEDAMEMSYFGAEVIHPSTLLPSIEKRIPLVIKNTLNPTASGTLITSNPRKNEHLITGIASINNVSIINIEGNGMIGTPGVAAKVFQSLADKDINIIMISQASSEHSICLVCREEEAKKAEDTLNIKLDYLIKSHKIKKIKALPNNVIVAIIGDNMKGKPGLTGKLFSSLGKNEINVLAIAQGSSERNISIVLDINDKNSAINIIHNSFLED